MVIHFDKGITGVVGPNGCGKSNVVDAIRWVLGEQKSRMLRSDKMENVIFNGTKNRKPTNLAEVSLTFENTRNLLPTEYTHVTITRRYYRSGESEYLINGVTCRLKDITNLFMDTGINSNSYAIIELKMIDELLNDKNNSRRELFEEAAGISKFKTRKRESLKKLSDTDADLERVEDVLYEIEKNLKSLEKQAKQAEKYFQLKDTYKEISINLAKRSVAAFREDLLGLQAQITQKQDEQGSIQSRINLLEAGIEEAKAGLLQKEKLLSSRQKTLNEQVNKIRQFESEKKIKNERLRFLEDRSQKLRDSLDQDRKSNDRAGFSIRSLEQELESTEKRFREQEIEMEELKAIYESKKERVRQFQEEQKIKQERFAQAKERVYQLAKEQEIKQIQLSTLKQELEKTTTADYQQEHHLQEFEDKAAELLDKLQQQETEVERLSAKQLKLEQDIEETEKVAQLIKDELVQLNRKLDAKQNEFNLTKSLVDNLEGFPEAIKFLKKNASWGKDTPLLSDVLTTAENYRVVIENYLESYMNYYVVETREQALSAVNMLSDASRGKANFFILDEFQQYMPRQEQLFPNARPAVSIVDYDSKYRRLIAFLLDNVYVVEGDFRDFPEREGHVFLAASGKIIRRPFSISGGSVGLFEGKRLGRAKNLEKLEETIKQLQKTISYTRNKLEDKTSEILKLRAQQVKPAIDTARQEVDQTRQAYIAIRTKKEQLAELLTTNANKREDIEQRVEELLDALSVLEPDLLEARERLLILQEEAEQVQEELQVLNEALAQRSAAYNEANIRFHQGQNRVNSLEQEIDFKQKAFESSAERIQVAQQELSGLDQEIRNLLGNNEVKDEELFALYEEKEAIESGLTESEQSYYAARGAIDEQEKEVRLLQRQKEQFQTLLQELQQAATDLNMRMHSLRERLSVEFELDLDALMEEDPEVAEAYREESPEALRRALQQQKEKLEKMGPINPMAMEAYDEIKERHTFILEQKADLIDAKNSLVKTIGEIDQVVRETFLDAFEKIKSNFIKVFRSLFTEEDDCDLKLVDPTNPLESAIEIMAKPKGKRPLTINQLSGGEKTLTATSLLFAIYLLKPAPFCIFDEVDAPLDDANIDKFNQIIKTFSSESQFIIVTHNKRTMASTDVIYGITMIEAGVSRVVPVDLRALA